MTNRPPQNRIYDSLKAAAAGMKIPLSRLQKLKAQGADGFVNGRVDSGLLAAWISTHPAPAAATPPVKVANLPTGAGSALLRLEEQEALSYQTMNAAIASGDTDEIERTRRAWLEVSEQLRKGDLAVELARRGGQEAIPRSDIENLLGEILHTWAVALKLQLIGIGYSLHKATPDEARDILENVSHEGLREAITTARSWNAGRPAWLYDAVLSNLRHVYSAKQMKALAS